MMPTETLRRTILIDGRPVPVMTGEEREQDRQASRARRSKPSGMTSEEAMAQARRALARQKSEG